MRVTLPEGRAGAVAFFRVGVVLCLAMAAAAAAQPPVPVIVIETERGSFEVETYPAEAPKTTAHIVDLVRQHFYDGLRFHRAIPNFIVQVGDPASRQGTPLDELGSGGSGTPVGVSEISKVHTHVRGAVALAHPGDARKGDSQFYIMLAPAPRLDGAYAVFGRVTSGMDVVAKLAAGDRIIRATVKGER
jgi:cyclophilin family peptidyl-prolyl cis-trans isomerase